MRDVVCSGCLGTIGTGHLTKNGKNICPLSQKEQMAIEREWQKIERARKPL